jgi:hypothetical protein
MPRGAYHCLFVAAGTLSYLTLIPRLPDTLFQYKIVYAARVDRGYDIHSHHLYHTSSIQAI